MISVFLKCWVMARNGLLICVIVDNIVYCWVYEVLGNITNNFSTLLGDSLKPNVNLGSCSKTSRELLIYTVVKIKKCSF